MSLPRFRPADAVARPRQFGRVETPIWSGVSGLSPVEFGWARLQHRVAFDVRAELEREGLGIPDLAAETGVAPSWLTRKLNGRAPVDLGDVVGWVLRFGPHVWPVVDDLSELRPPGSRR